MVIEHRLRIERAAQHHVAHREQMVEDVIVLGLEREAGQPHRAHQRTVAQPERRGVDVAGIGQAVAGAGFLLVPGCRSEPFGHVSSFLSSWGVAVAAPALPIPDPRAPADLGDPQVEDPRLAQAGEIADHVHGQRHGKREEAAR